jgi:hypothetical protein
LIRWFPIYTAKRNELRSARAWRVFSSTWTTQYAITAQRLLKNMRRDTLRELLTHLIHQISAHVTFGYLGSWSRIWRSEFFRVKNKFWVLSPRVRMSSHSRTSREFSIIEWNT